MPSGPRKAELTAQGHPRATFKRAIERGNLMVAEVTARELGRITLGEALELTILIAQHDSRRHQRVAVRWLQRYIDEHPEVTLDDALLASSCLAALAGRNFDDAAVTLRAMSERATSRRSRRSVA
jgi:ribosomal protein S7